jgi:hypothetical protein
VVSSLSVKISTTGETHELSDLTRVADGIWVGILEARLRGSLTHEVERLLAAIQESPYDRFGLSYIFVRDQLCALVPHSDVFSSTLTAQIESMLRDVVYRQDDRCLISTPQLRLFVKDSFRAWGKDQIPDGLRYVVTIKVPRADTKTQSTIEIALPELDVRNAGPSLAKSVSIELIPGRVVIHETSLQYKLSTVNDSSDPREALILVDGYIW